MKKTILLAALLLTGIGSAFAQSPNGTKIEYDNSCPATVTANTTKPNSGNITGPSTKTVNNSTTHDARTTVTDSRGNQSSYTTPAKSTVDGYDDRSHSQYLNADNPNVSKIEVTCSPTEKK